MIGSGLRWASVPAAVLAAALAFAASAAAKNQVYWGNEANNTISFANQDNTGGGGQLAITGATADTPNGVAIDPATNKIYWANTNNNTISYASLDGGGGGQLNTTGATLNRPDGIAIDPATNKIYWANSGNNTISFANLDNTGGGGQLNTTGATLNDPRGIAIDPTTGKVYWTNAGNDTVSFANLNDTGGGGQLNTTGATLSRPAGLAIDAATNKVYWANEGTSTISFANLNDTGGGGQLNTTGATLDAPIGIAVDPAANKVYTANDSTISYANADNTGGGGQLNTSGATTDSLAYPALLELPSGAGAPKVSGGSTTGSKLRCSQGTWASDLLESFLFRAPQSFSYTWTRNGSTIPGATSNTITAKSPGNYACQVTADNHAGTTTQASAAHKVSNPKLKLWVSPRSAQAGKRTCFTFTTTNQRRVVPGARIRFVGHTAHTSARGTAQICAVLSIGNHRATAAKSGYRDGSTTVRGTRPPPAPKFTA